MCGHFSKDIFQEWERILIQSQANHCHRARTEPAAICYQFLSHNVEDEVLEILEFARAATRISGLPRLKLRFNGWVTLADGPRWVKRRLPYFFPVVRLFAIRPRWPPLRHALTRSAVWPVIFSHRAIVWSQYSGASSNPIMIRPSFIRSAARTLIPLPRNGSTIMSPGLPYF